MYRIWNSTPLPSLFPEKKQRPFDVVLHKVGTLSSKFHTLKEAREGIFCHFKTVKIQIRVP